MSKVMNTIKRDKHLIHVEILKAMQDRFGRASAPDDNTVQVVLEQSVGAPRYYNIRISAMP